ncbi:MAG: ABC transporter permease [Candidatus Hydrogenedentes bacterium]|nr:ABC transporter permease [Candidatus Hydrogenedentota bacterium]
MSETVEIGNLNLALAYGLLVFPLAIILWYRVPILGETAQSVVRMTVQLVFVGLYLEVVFRLNWWWLNALWLLVMMAVADVSVIRGAGLRMRRFMIPLFIALLVGSAVPLLFFVGVILRRPSPLEAQFAIPIGGMILGNCLRADIIGIRNFYEAIRKSEKAFLHTLAQGARLGEATRPYMRNATHAALGPTVATMATIGIVALPGMMTGVILAGANPLTAIKYQIAIMIAIFSGTAITVALAIWLTMTQSFTPYGTLDADIFRK